MTILIGILIFGVLIFVHELGHFISARCFGVRVNEFAVGMGPALFRKKKGDTEYSLRLFPIGGYCNLEGENGNSDSPDAFNNKPFLSKVLVIVAGSAMNFLLALLLLIVFYISTGIPTNSIGALTEDGMAKKAGLSKGDRIVQVENVPINDWSEVSAAINSTSKDNISVTVERNGELKKYNVGIETSENGKRIIGIKLKYSRNPLVIMPLGVKNTLVLCNATIDALIQLFTGKISVEHLSGPVGVVYMVDDVAAVGMNYVVVFAALISMNLALVNMLPFPALDGGRLLLLIIRFFFKNSVSDDLEEKIHIAGIILLFGFMIFITYQDIGKLFK